MLSFANEYFGVGVIRSSGHRLSVVMAVECLSLSLYFRLQIFIKESKVSLPPLST